MNKKGNEIPPFKILIVGDSNVGKTSLLLKYVDDIFQETHLATIGVEFKLKEITLDNKIYKLNIWDTAGQERFKSITKSFFKAADGIVFVYDITKKATFDNLKNWINDAESKTTNFKSIVVGNKIDLENNREVDYNLGKNFCEKKNCPFLETSAKINMRVEDIFLTLVKDILKYKVIKENENMNKVTLNSNNYSNKKKNNKCC